MRLSPDFMVATVTDIEPEFLKQQGIKAVMVDLDDTLVASNSSLLSQEYRHWLESIKTAGVKVLILSNGSPARVRYWSEELGLPGFALVGKPFAFAFRKGLKKIGAQAHETAMIGDQIFTDILGANLSGLKSILVKPLTAGKYPHTRLARRLERRILRGGEHARTFHR